jgi:hypothetical protein
MADLNSADRDWLVEILGPTIALRDALITDVADGVSSVTEPPTVAVRMIEVVLGAERPTLRMHLRSWTAMTGDQAETVAMETIHKYASRLDLSAVTVTVIGQPSPDEPSMQ